MLRADLDNENDTIRNYRERLKQCEALQEYAIAEDIREILRQEQEHQIDLATALGEDVPDVSRLRKAGKKKRVSRNVPWRGPRVSYAAWAVPTSTYFLIIFGPTSAPKMFPCASAATPSAPLVADASGFSSGSGMKAVTLPSRALPTRMPRFQPGLRLVFDSESAP